MIFKLTNIGSVKSADIDINELNVLYGDNNTGKTYITYSIWGAINHLARRSSIDISANQVKELLNTGKVFVSANSASLSKSTQDSLENFSKKIGNIFNAQNNFFDGVKVELRDFSCDFLEENASIAKIKFGESEQTQIDIKMVKDGFEIVMISTTEQIEIPNKILQDYIGKVIATKLFSKVISRAFAITSERTGVSLFYKDLDRNKGEALNYLLQNKNINPFELMDKLTSRYALPIQKNIDFVRDYDQIKKKQSYLCSHELGEVIFKLWEDISGGKYYEENDTIVFKVKRGVKLPISLASSAIKSLFLIDAYLRYEAKMGDVLFIDEPELNLTPKNQVAMAKLLVLLSSTGVKIFITTHSDYITREINIAILSYQNSLGEISISHKKVSAYSTNNKGVVKKISITENGFDVDSFDKVIQDQIQRSFV